MQKAEATHLDRSTTTTVTLSEEPWSMAARVSTLAATRAAVWREAPRCCARRRHRCASEQASCGARSSNKGRKQDARYQTQSW